MKKLIVLGLAFLFLCSFFTACVPPRDGKRGHYHKNHSNRIDGKNKSHDKDEHRRHR